MATVALEAKLSKQQILEMTVAIGFLLLRYGGEVYRVEESISRIGLAYGMKSMEVFAIQSSLIVTLIPPDGQAITETRRITERVTDLDKIDKLNSLCRYICQHTPEYGEIGAKLEEIRGGPTYGFGIQLFAFAMIAFNFTLFMGGHIKDACCALVIGIGVKIVLKYLANVKANDFMSNLVGGFLTASFALICYSLQLLQNTDMVIIGILMNLVPGLALTNSVRDFISGDFVAGIVKMVEALFVAVGIAVGVGIPLALFF